MNYAELFKGFFPDLDRALDIVPADRVKLIGFNRRENEHSVSFVMMHGLPSDRVFFENLIGFNLPDDFYETPTGQVGVLCVDLSSIGTNMIRIYHNCPQNNPKNIEDEWVENIGYYLDENKKVIGKKKYIRSWKDRCYYIDYYDENDNLVRSREVENEGIAEDWNGNFEILNICKENNIPYIFSKKNGKDQGYLIVNVSPSMSFYK